MIEAPGVQEAPDTHDHPGTLGPGAEDSAPANPQAGSHATAAQAIPSPTALPTLCSPHWLDQSCCQYTAFWYSQDSFKIIPADSVETSSQPEGSVLTERASNGQVSFYTRLQVFMKNGKKLMTMKIDPGAQVSTIPWAGIGSFYPQKSMRPGILRPIPSPLQPTPGSHMMESLSPS